MLSSAALLKTKIEGGFDVLGKKAFRDSITESTAIQSLPVAAELNSFDFKKKKKWNPKIPLKSVFHFPYGFNKSL